jgi:hypothetical protein
MGTSLPGDLPTPTDKIHHQPLKNNQIATGNKNIINSASYSAQFDRRSKIAIFD